MLVEPMLFVHLSIEEGSIMTQLTSRISSEADLKAHIASYPELYEDLAVDALEDRLEMGCFINYGCECDELDQCHGYCEEHTCESYDSCSMDDPETGP